MPQQTIFVPRSWLIILIHLPEIVIVVVKAIPIHEEISIDTYTTPITGEKEKPAQHVPWHLFLYR